MSITIQQLSKRFGATLACDCLDLTIATGERVALLGPSGCGKTTLLRIIAGLERPDAGRVLLHGEDATDRDVRERGIGFVFQHYALFGHLTVFENVAFGLRVRPRATRPSEAQIRERVGELLERVELAGLAGHHPQQLSGGQRQRVALARALATEPRVLLLDEPFGALDARVRKELRRWLRRLHQALPVTSVFVTHDQEEAMEVADRVVVLNQGRIEQVGTPEEVYDQPASPFVLRFLGDANRLGTPADAGAPAFGYARPHELELIGEPGPDTWPANLTQTLMIGPTVRLELRLAGTGDRVEAELSREAFLALRARLGLQAGTRVHLRARRIRRFREESAQAA